MSATTLTKQKAETNIGMSQVALIADGDLARAVLGSCIGLALHYENQPIAVVSHIVLPEAMDRTGPPAKFADTAIPHMLDLLKKHVVGRTGLVAKMAGGANMFGSSGPIQIGESNRVAVTQILDELGIPLVGQHVGGLKGRRITFDSQTGELTVEVMGEKAVIL